MTTPTTPAAKTAQAEDILHDANDPYKKPTVRSVGGMAPRQRPAKQPDLTAPSIEDVEDGTASEFSEFCILTPPALSAAPSEHEDAASVDENVALLDKQACVEEGKEEEEEEGKGELNDDGGDKGFSSLPTGGRLIFNSPQQSDVPVDEKVTGLDTVANSLAASSVHQKDDTQSQESEQKQDAATRLVVTISPRADSGSIQSQQAVEFKVQLKISGAVIRVSVSTKPENGASRLEQPQSDRDRMTEQYSEVQTIAVSAEAATNDSRSADEHQHATPKSGLIRLHTLVGRHDDTPLLIDQTGTHTATKVERKVRSSIISNSSPLPPSSSSPLAEIAKSSLAVEDKHGSGGLATTSSEDESVARAGSSFFSFLSKVGFVALQGFTWLLILWIICVVVVAPGLMLLDWASAALGLK